MGQQWKQWQTLFFILGGSKITVDGDCNHEVKRRLLLGRKVMTNLDSILKSRDITFPTKVHLVRAVVFSNSHVWMWDLDYKESWVPKNWCFCIVLMEKTLESLLDIKGIQPVHPKEFNWNNPEYSLEGLMLKLKLQYFGHLMRATDSLEKTPMQEEKGTREDEMIGWHHWLNAREFELTLGDGEGQGSLVCRSPWGHKESDVM